MLQIQPTEELLRDQLKFSRDFWQRYGRRLTGDEQDELRQAHVGLLMAEAMMKGEVTDYPNRVIRLSLQALRTHVKIFLRIRQN
jgi:hypothetical protein